MKKLLGCFSMRWKNRNAQFKSIENYNQEDDKTKPLIIYYSHSGNTEILAKKIKDLMNCDMAPLETVEIYPEKYREMKKRAKFCQNAVILPKLKSIPNISEYSSVFIGTPVWFGKISLPVQAFLTATREQWKGKILIPFMTHGGGGAKKALQNIQTIVPDANIRKAFIWMRLFPLNNKKLFNFVSSIKSV